MRRPIVFACDPGIANLGWVNAAIDMQKNRITLVAEPGEDLGYGVILTEHESGRSGDRKVVDHMRRVMEISEQIEPRIANSDAVAIEAMSFGYANAQTMAIMCLVYGAIGAIAQRHALPVVQISPQKMKKKLMNRRDATKIEIQAAVNVRVPGARAANETILPSKVEHLADAIGIGVACLDDPIIKATLASWRKNR